MVDFPHEVPVIREISACRDVILSRSILYVLSCIYLFQGLRLAWCRTSSDYIQTWCTAMKVLSDPSSMPPRPSWSTSAWRWTRSSTSWVYPLWSSVVIKSHKLYFTNTSLSTSPHTCASKTMQNVKVKLFVCSKQTFAWYEQYIDYLCQVRHVRRMCLISLDHPFCLFQTLKPRCILIAFFTLPWWEQTSLFMAKLGLCFLRSNINHSRHLDIFRDIHVLNKE